MLLISENPDPGQQAALNSAFCARLQAATMAVPKNRPRRMDINYRGSEMIQPLNHISTQKALLLIAYNTQHLIVLIYLFEELFAMQT